MIAVTACHAVTPAAIGPAACLDVAMGAAPGAMCRHESWHGLRDAFCASLFADADIPRIEGLTDVEALAVAALRDTPGTRLDSPDTQLIISSTKGNVGHAGRFPEERGLLCSFANAVAEAAGAVRPPVAVCNACISGVNAIILAKRMIEAGVCRRAVVCGVELQSKFIISGFLSFKALSDEPCRPFDKDRRGLNAGEACAVMVLEAAEPAPGVARWWVEAGGMANDANHISAPSRTAEGSLRALRAAMCGVAPEDVGFVSCHGTATAYNDAMEAVALCRAGLSGVPAVSFKGAFGHTMGAAGVLETVVAMEAARRGVVPPTLGFAAQGDEQPIRVSAEAQECAVPRFIKLISGFGGCNAAVRLAFTDRPVSVTSASASAAAVTPVLSSAEITPEGACIDGRAVDVQSRDAALLTELYRRYDGAHPKYFKMDGLSRLAFVGVQMLMDAVADGEEWKEGTSVILFNRASSVNADRRHADSLLGEGADGSGASPATFVYTLPNIANGEIALRRGWHGETAFYVMDDPEGPLAEAVVAASMQGMPADCSQQDVTASGEGLTAGGRRRLVTGTVEYLSGSDFHCRLTLR